MNDALAWYAAPAPMTDLRRHSEWIAGLPHEIEALCAAVQGLVLHRNWAAAYQVELPEARNADAQRRSAGSIIDRILELSKQPLHEAREPLDRFAGTCRDFSVLLCSLLRHRGVPARARCGFGTYFEPGNYVDHWLCEHWDAARECWVQTDAQLDALQVKALQLDFDPLEVPRDRFVIAGAAWRRCIAGEIDPARCGIFDMHGLWFVRANVLRDLAALNKVELLPWDDWGMLLTLGEQDEAAAQRAKIERAAALTCEHANDPTALRAFYESEPELRVPATVRNWQTGADEAAAGGFAS